MFLSDYPCLSLAIQPLTSSTPLEPNYAIWVLQAPVPRGFTLHERPWTPELAQAWQTWQSMFSLRGLPAVPHIFPVDFPPPTLDDMPVSGPGQEVNYSSRLMQQLGIYLWQWLFDGPIQSSFDQSQGIAIGQRRPLRLRLEIRDPELIALPWEIMQSQPGKQAISLSQQLLFSRTTSVVEPLPPLRTEHALKVLLVLGQDIEADAQGMRLLPHGEAVLQLEQEAAALTKVLRESAKAEGTNQFPPTVSCDVTTLLQPSPAELTDALETQSYNVFFYSGHGAPAPDGGLLFLQPDAAINGTELAQVLTRCHIKLAVFNACWGAQPDHQNGRAIPSSSLAEVLINHGVPAVLGMRDSIADREALSFIQMFAQSLAERRPIDESVAIARQHLLTLYRFNQPAWTLPVLYMHPQFDGELIKPLNEGVTEIPDTSASWLGQRTPPAYLQSLNHPVQVWRIDTGIIRIGNMLDANDMVLQVPGVSRKHAEIFYRDLGGGEGEASYVLRDFSRYGTLIRPPHSNGWVKVHQREVPLQSKTHLKFGNILVEFVVEG